MTEPSGSTEVGSGDAPVAQAGNRLQRAALIAEIVGGTAVVISLMFVGVQIRENANVLAAQAVFDLREANGSLVRDLTGNQELSEMLFRGYNDYSALSEVERWRFGLWVNEVLRIRLMAWEYGERGLLDQNEFDSWRDATCDYLRAYSWARMVWDSGGAYLRTDFRERVQERCFSR
jgi:hypothetical protein